MDPRRPTGVVTASIPALLLATLVLVPFASKAFTVDDTFFLLSARHALVEPLRPLAFELTWDRIPQRASQIAPTGPVMPWLLMPAVAAGGSEVLAHLVSLAFLWIGALATVSLAVQLGLTLPWASAAGVLLVSMPAVLGMAGTAMPDVTAMALGVAGIDRLLAWRRSGRPRDGALAAVLLGAAPLARTHLIALLGVGGLFLLDAPADEGTGSQRRWRRWIPLVAAPLLTAGVLLVTRDPVASESGILATATRLSGTRTLSSNVVAFGGHWVLAMTFGIPWAILRWKEIARSPWALLLGTGAAALLLHLEHGAEAPLYVAPIAGLGYAGLTDVVVDALRRRDRIQLALAAWTLAPLPAVVYWHFPSKYLVAAAPAAAVLVVRRLPGSPGWARIAVAATAGAGVLLGVAILRADAAFAEVGRTAVRTLVAPAIATGRPTWFIGQRGFQWYAESAGARCWSAAPPYPVQGDLIAYADNLATAIPRAEMESLTHLGRVEDRRPGGRIMSKPSGAGFYSNSWGYLPWAWGDDAIDAVDLWLAVPRQAR